MNTIKLEPNIPIPRGTRGVENRFPFKEMNVGDSFFTADRSARQAAYDFAQNRNFNMKFATRKVDGGLRIWRICLNPHNSPRQSGRGGR